MCWAGSEFQGSAYRGKARPQASHGPGVDLCLEKDHVFKRECNNKCERGEMPWFRSKKKTGTINGGRGVLAELTHTWGRRKNREKNGPSSDAEGDWRREPERRSPFSPSRSPRVGEWETVLLFSTYSLRGEMDSPPY